MIYQIINIKSVIDNIVILFSPNTCFMNILRNKPLHYDFDKDISAWDSIVLTEKDFNQPEKITNFSNRMPINRKHLPYKCKKDYWYGKQEGQLKENGVYLNHDLQFAKQNASNFDRLKLKMELLERGGDRWQQEKSQTVNIQRLVKRAKSSYIRPAIEEAKLNEVNCQKSIMSSNCRERKKIRPSSHRQNSKPLTNLIDNYLFKSKTIHHKTNRLQSVRSKRQKILSSRTNTLNININQIESGKMKEILRQLRSKH